MAVVWFGVGATIVGVGVAVYLYVDATVGTSAVVATVLMALVTAASTAVAWRKRGTSG